MYRGPKVMRSIDSTDVKSQKTYTNDRHESLFDTGDEFYRRRRRKEVLGTVDKKELIEEFLNQVPRVERTTGDGDVGASQSTKEDTRTTRVPKGDISVNYQT